MPEASCSLELLEMVLTKHRNPEETEEVSLTSESPKDASSSSVLMESVRMESRQCSKSSTTWSKRSNPNTLVQMGRRLVLTPCPGTQGKCVI